MKAAVLHGREEVRIEDVPPLPLAPGMVRIRIEAALTCGTDLKVFKRGYHARMIVPPAVFGHELSGVVCEVHPETVDWVEGERVAVANSAPCGECIYCREGRENLCDDLLFLNGAYAESIAVPARLVEKNLLRLKSTTPFRDAALVEPLACVVQGVEDVKLLPSQSVLILGTGPIGLMFVALAKQAGCVVTAAGRGEVRLRMARELGAHTVLDIGGREDIAAGIRAQTAASFDAVIEAVGKPEAWEACVKLVRKGGTVNFFGGCPAGTTAALDTGLIHYSGLTLLASFHHTPKTIRKALEHIESGLITANHFVNGECALTGLPELFRNMAAGNRAVKTLIRVRE